MTSPLVGRSNEIKLLDACLAARRNVLLEGPVGVGKTHLALHLAEAAGKKVYRVDGDARFTEQKLTGWYDPPTVIRDGYVPDAFIPGPLVSAMKDGAFLFINELNRLPEGVQNVLLPAIDERKLQVPRYGEVRAHEGFLVIATQNPKEFVATSHLSEAILDRFELVRLDYQSEEEELQIVSERIANAPGDARLRERFARASVALVRSTRSDPKIRRGASIRAALSIAEIGLALAARGASFEDAFRSASAMALPTRIEPDPDAEAGDLVKSLAGEASKKKR